MAHGLPLCVEHRRSRCCCCRSPRRSTPPASPHAPPTTGACLINKQGMIPRWTQHIDTHQVPGSPPCSSPLCLGRPAGGRQCIIPRWTQRHQQAPSILTATKFLVALHVHHPRPDNSLTRFVVCRPSLQVLVHAEHLHRLLGRLQGRRHLPHRWVGGWLIRHTRACSHLLC